MKDAFYLILVRYFIDSALLVMIHILLTQKWASGYNPTLLSERRIEGRYVYKSYGFLVKKCMNTALLIIIHILYTQKRAGGHRCSLRHNVCHPATFGDCEIIYSQPKKNRLYRFFHKHRNLRGYFDEKRLDRVF